MQRYPLFLLSLFWLTGLYLGYYQIDLSLFIWVIGLGLGFLLVALSIGSYYRKSKYWLVWLIFAVIIFAFFRMTLYQDQHQTQLSNEFVQEDQEIGIRGYIAATPMIDGDLVKLMVSPISYQWDQKEVPINSKEKVLVYIYLRTKSELQKVHEWENGMGIMLYGKLEKPQTAKNPGQFDYRNYLEKRGVYWKVEVDQPSTIKVSDRFSLLASLNRVKDKLTLQIDQLYTEPNAGFLKALLLGEDQQISEELKEDFSILGLSHLLAISGLHLSMITFVIFWLLTKIGLTREHIAITAGFVLIGYMFLTGASASVVRATLMALLMFYGLIYKRALFSLQSLATAFILMTFYQPMWIYDIGFQLSFVVTLTLIWGYSRVEKRIPIKQRWLRSTLTVLIITQFASFPLAFYYFHQYSLLSWLGNFLFVPIFSMVIPVSFALLFFSFFSFNLIEPLASILNWTLSQLFEVIHLFSKLSVFHFYGYFPFIKVVLLYTLFFWILIRNEVKNAFISYDLKKKIFLLEKISILLLVVALIIPVFLPKQGMVTFIDVGQGDSILIQTPGNDQVLIDAGGTLTFQKEDWQKRKNQFDTGEDIILPYLHYMGIDVLDMAVLTHEDQDHIGGYLSLVDQLEIRTFVVGKEFPRTELGKELQKKLIEKKIKIIHVNQIQHVKLDNESVFTFIPIDISGSLKENDHMLVAFLKLYDTSIALPGDLEEIGEYKILDTYHVKPIDILKVGHHGSKTSTSDLWLQSLEPKEAVISVGENNLYRHPSNEVVQRLQEQNINIWRTDQDGAIMIYINNDGFRIEKKIKNDEIQQQNITKIRQLREEG
ncbi:MAG: DNA internalization-related competence protein ComEC/Rec2 [Tepidibacillus sp.]